MPHATSNGKPRRNGRAGGNPPTDEQLRLNNRIYRVSESQESQECQESQEYHVPGETPGVCAPAPPGTAEQPPGSNSRGGGVGELDWMDSSPADPDEDTPQWERAVAMARELAGEVLADGSLDGGGMPAEVSLPFRLARRLRRLGGVNPEALQPAVTEFARLVNDPEEVIDPAALWYAFLDLWDKVAFAEGEDPFDLAARRADTDPRWPRDDLGGEFARLVRLAAQLWEYTRPKPFALPQDRISRWLGCSQPTVSRLVSLMKSRGYVRQAKEHDRRARKAAEYTFTATAETFDIPY